MVSDSLSSLFILNSIVFCSAPYLFCIYFFYLTHLSLDEWLTPDCHFILFYMFFFFLLLYFLLLRFLIHATVALSFPSAHYSSLPGLLWWWREERRCPNMWNNWSGYVLAPAKSLSNKLMNTHSLWSSASCFFPNWRGGCQHTGVALGAILIRLFVYISALESDNTKLCWRPNLVHHTWQVFLRPIKYNIHTVLQCIQIPKWSADRFLGPS